MAAVSTLEEVTGEVAVGLEVSDHGLDGGSALEFLLDHPKDTELLSREMHPEGFRRGGVHDQPTGIGHAHGNAPLLVLFRQEGQHLARDAQEGALRAGTSMKTAARAARVRKRTAGLFSR